MIHEGRAFGSQQELSFDQKDEYFNRILDFLQRPIICPIFGHPLIPLADTSAFLLSLDRLYSVPNQPTPPYNDPLQVTQVASDIGNKLFIRVEGEAARDTWIRTIIRDYNEPLAKVIESTLLMTDEVAAPILDAVGVERSCDLTDLEIGIIYNNQGVDSQGST